MTADGIVLAVDPAMVAAIGRVKGVSSPPVVRSVDPLATPAVLRLTVDGDEGPRQFVVKRMTGRRAETIRLVLHELLPSFGLSGIAGHLFFDVDVAGVVWQLYDDLGDATLARLALGTPVGETVDLGFLSPATEPVPVAMLDTAIDAAAELHGRFAGRVDRRARHRLAPLEGEAVAAGFDRAMVALRARRTTKPSWAVVCDELLDRLADGRRRCDAELLAAAGPPTLVHGDLGLNNVVASGTGAVRFVDWEHAGHGQGGYDLSTLLGQLRPDQRRHALDRYVARAGDAAPAPLTIDEWNALFAVFEQGRIASCVTAASPDVDADWSLDRLDKCATWLRSIGPLVSDAPAEPAP